ncbi:hypothetical protein JCM5353_002623 [Sporobolomyces roseus]
MPGFTLSPAVRRQARILAGLKLRPGPSPVRSPSRWGPEGGSAPPSSASSRSTALAIPGQKLPIRAGMSFATSSDIDLGLWLGRQGPSAVFVSTTTSIYSPMV